MRALVILILLTSVAAADPRSDAQKRFYIGVKAYHANNFAAAAEHFEEAYKILPLPEIAFSAAQSYRRQYRIDRKIERAQRAVELYRIYLDAVKTGGQVGIAADRELQNRQGPAKPVAAPVVERTTIVINPVLATERSGDGFELSEAPADTAKIVALLDGKPVPVYDKIDVEPGPHKIHVEVEGYVPSDVTERAVKDSNTTANVKLAPLPAKVTVKTEAGVTLRVDGRPATGPELALPAGRHVITITKQGRESVAREVVV
jgi:tetratricopeptide (TPR) repeat protein